MSFFKTGMTGIQEAFIFALMIIFIIAVIYSNIDFRYKIGIGALVFTIIFIASLANQVLKQQEEKK
ncbi:MAG: hypothetical protein GX638_09060 [Crenarchaeota archaeon]|nr:hypothetical protein [Thermoproteota archaeon]